MSTTPSNDSLVVIYRNYRDEVRERHIRPVRWWFGKTEYHSKPGWVCTAVDLDRKPEDGSVVTRDFALTGFLAIGQDAVDNYRAVQAALVVAAGG
jgi:hypothetical protein